MADRDFNIAHKISFAGPPMYPHSTPFPTYGTPNYVALLMNPQYPSLGPFGYSLPYVGQPLHSQDTPHSTSDTVSYDSPYANTDPSVHRNPTQDPKSHATPSNNTLISSEDSAPRGAKRKRNSHTSRRISRSKAGRIERKPTTTTAISEEDIEAQKDMFEREGKVYPQTLGELDALLTMANGGILPGRLSHETEMEVDNDATESDNGPANEATNAFTTRTGEGQDDEDIKAIVDSIVEDMMAFRDWQGRLPPGTYNAALYDSKRGLHLVSELKRLVALARPLVNVVVPVKVGHSISVFDRHLSTRAFTRKMPVPVPSVPSGTDMLPPPAPRSGGKRKRR